jgi:hypothetical protein
VSVRVKTGWSERSSGAKLSWLSDDKGPWQSEEKKGTQRNEEGRDQGSENGVQEGCWENFRTGWQVESQDGHQERNQANSDAENEYGTTVCRWFDPEANEPYWEALLPDFTIPPEETQDKIAQRHLSPWRAQKQASH